MIGALRETAPHADYINFASKRRTELSVGPKAIPESPFLYRCSGYLSMQKALAQSDITFELLEETRKITDDFTPTNRRSPVPTSTPDDLSCISSLKTTIFAYQPAEELSFRSMSDRYTYEAIRLTSRIYAHALARQIPFSEAAAQLHTIASPSSISNSHGPYVNGIPIHIRIKDALLRTNMTDCWGHLAGVLFWIALVAGASANPQSSAVVGGYVVRRESGDEEEARKWLAAVAVRCSIVLSFEHGGAMLETLKRMVAIQDVLAKGEESRAVVDPLFVETAVVAGAEGAYGPREPLDAQRGFVDFAQEFLEM